jgi:serine/threonine-protein kinase
MAANDEDSLPAGDEVSSRPTMAEGPTRDGPMSQDGWARRYQDLGLLGSGAMGEVRRVFDIVIQRTTALKTVNQANHPEAVRRFVEEAQIAGQLDHPNITPVYDLCIGPEGSCYFTMKLVGGRTLASVLHEDMAAPFCASVQRNLEVFLKVCDAMSFAHSRGVIHRDLKPENIMVGAHGQVYVMDWGVAVTVGGATPAVTLARPRRSGSLQEAGTIVGTIAYMAPEQALGLADDVDVRTDVFGLGAILYEMLTGHPPYDGAAMDELIARARRADVKPPEIATPGRDLPPELCRIAMRAMAPLRKDRYQDVAALRAEVDEFLRGGGWFATARFGPGAVIVTEGAPADAAYIITSGTCEAYKTIGGTEVRLRRMGVGDVFGETALLTNHPRSASVRALEDVVVKVVTPASIEHGLAAGSWLGALVRALAERFHDVDQQLSRCETCGAARPSRAPGDPR